jgi:hypothetical protein
MKAGTRSIGDNKYASSANSRSTTNRAIYKRCLM